MAHKLVSRDKRGQQAANMMDKGQHSHAGEQRQRKRERGQQAENRRNKGSSHSGKETKQERGQQAGKEINEQLTSW